MNSSESENPFVSGPKRSLGVEAYRRNTAVTLDLVFKSRFRKLELFLGTEPLDRLSKEYYSSRILEEPDVDLAPVGFSKFLNQNASRFGEYAGLVADIACIEEMKFLSVHSRKILDKPIYSELPTACLMLREYVFLFRSSYDLTALDDYLVQFSEGESLGEIQMDRLRKNGIYLVGREDWYSAKVLELSASADVFLQALQKGTSLLHLENMAERQRVGRNWLIELVDRLYKGGWLFNGDIRDT